MSPAPKIAGIGLVTPLGRSVDATWTALLAGQSVSDHTPLVTQASSPCGNHLNHGDLNPIPAGSGDIPVSLWNDLPRVTSLAIEAAHEAMKDAGWDNIGDHVETAVIAGTSKGPVESWLERAPPLSQPLSNKSENPNDPAGRLNFGLAEMATEIARHTGLTDGLRLTLSAACASGLHALIRGCMMIQSGQAKRVLVVAAEASVHPLFLASFQRLGVLPLPGELCRPFDVNRKGFLMSDAAAAVCLEASDLPGIYVDHYALGGDATHLTGSKSDGAVLKHLLYQVISTPGLHSPTVSPTSDNLCYVKLSEGLPSGGHEHGFIPRYTGLPSVPSDVTHRRDACDTEVDLIHAHGTGTVLNDAMELKVLESVSIPTEPWLYSHKGALGHSLGASGLVSVVINCMCHRTGRVPGNVNTTQPMVHGAMKISAEAQTRRVDRSIVISSGFGGPTAVVGLTTRRGDKGPRIAPPTRVGTNWVILFLIVIFAGVLRGQEVSLVGYWTDELCSLSAAQGWGLQLYKVPLDQIAPPLPVCTRLKDAKPLWQVPAALARDDTHPPVYLLMLRLWEDIFGDNESATRSLNICFSLIAIVLLYVAAKAAIGSSAALWAALLMAVASPQIMFSLEARDYMPALAFSLAATVAFLRLCDNRSTGVPPDPGAARRGRDGRATKAAALFGVMLLLMMLTHYYCAGVAATLVVHGLIWMRGRSRWLLVVATISAAVLFAVIWGRSFLQEIPNFRANTEWLFDTGPGHLSRCLLRISKVPGILVAADLPNASAIFGLLFLLLPIAYFKRPELRLWVLWFVVTVGLIAGQDLVRSTTQLSLPRYLLFATPAEYVLLAGAMRGRWRWLPPAAGVLTALLSLRSAYLPAWKIDLRTPVEFTRLNPDDGLVISGPDTFFDGITYAAYQHYLPSMPAASVVLTKPADAATLDRLRRCRHLWVLWMWPGRPVREILPGYIPADRGHLPYFGDLIQGKLTYVQRAIGPSFNLQK